MAFTNATFIPGIDLVFKETDFFKKIDGVDYIITGEGKLDRQTAMGKGPAGVGKTGLERGIPVIAMAGIVEEGAEEDLKKVGITRAICINPPGSTVEESMKLAAERLEAATEKFFREI